jgi:hypothetical protein
VPLVHKAALVYARQLLPVITDPGFDFDLGGYERVASPDLTREPGVERFAGVSGLRIKV